jgi:hypothetical protein
MVDEVFEDAIGLRPYDEALINFFSLNIHPDMKNKKESIVLTPTMTPRREFAAQDEIRSNFTNEEAEGRLNYTIAVPALALSRMDFSLDQSRWSLAGFRKIRYTEDGNRILQSDSPYPVRIHYQLDAWLKYQSMANQVIRNVLLKFDKREVWLPIDFKGEFGIHHVPIELLDGPKNLTNLDPGSAERTLRYMFRFVLKAYIIPDVTSIPTVRKTSVNYYVAAHDTAVIPTTAEETDLAYNDWIKMKTIITDEDIDPTLGNP